MPVLYLNFSSIIKQNWHEFCLLIITFSNYCARNIIILDFVLIIIKSSNFEVSMTIPLNTGSGQTPQTLPETETSGLQRDDSPETNVKEPVTQTSPATSGMNVTSNPERRLIVVPEGFMRGNVPSTPPPKLPVTVIEASPAHELPTEAISTGRDTDSQAVEAGIKLRSSADLFESTGGTKDSLSQARNEAINATLDFEAIGEERMAAKSELKELSDKLKIIDKKLEMAKEKAAEAPKNPTEQKMQVKYQEMQAKAEAEKGKLEGDLAKAQAKYDKTDSALFAAQDKMDKANAKFEALKAEPPKLPVEIVAAEKSEAPPKNKYELAHEAAEAKFEQALAKLGDLEAKRFDIQVGDEPNKSELLSQLDQEIYQADVDYHAAGMEMQTAARELEASSGTTEFQATSNDQHTSVGERLSDAKRALLIANADFQDAQAEYGEIEAQLSLVDLQLGGLNPDDEKTEGLKNRKLDLEERLILADEKRINAENAVVDVQSEINELTQLQLNASIQEPLLTPILDREVPVAQPVPLKESVEPIAFKLETQIINTRLQPKSSLAKKFEASVALIEKLGPNQKLVQRNKQDESGKTDKSLHIVDKEFGFSFREGSSEGSMNAINTLINNLSIAAESSTKDVPLKDILKVYSFLMTNSTAQAVIKKNPEFAKTLSSFENKMIKNNKISELEMTVVQLRIAGNEKLAVIDGKLRMVPRERSMFGEPGTGAKSREAILLLLNTLETELNQIEPGNKEKKLPLVKEMREFLRTNEWAQAAMTHAGFEPDLPEFDDLLEIADKMTAITQEYITGRTQPIVTQIDARLGEIGPDEWSPEIQELIRNLSSVLEDRNVKTALTSSMKARITGRTAQFGTNLNVQSLLNRLLDPNEQVFRSQVLKFERINSKGTDIFAELSKSYANSTPREKVMIANLCKEWISDPGMHQEQFPRINSLIEQGLKSTDPQELAVWKEVEILKNNASSQPPLTGKVYAPPANADILPAQQSLLSEIRDTKKADMPKLVKNTAALLANANIQGFQQVKPSELNGHFERKSTESMPNVAVLLQRSINIGTRVQDLVLLGDRQDRSSTIEFFVAVATESAERGDFFTMEAIYQALNSSAISNLPEMKTVAAKNADYQKLESLNSSDVNYKALRSAIAKQENVIPPIRLVGKDLFAAIENNPNRTKGVINTNVYSIVESTVNLMNSPKRMQVDSDVVAQNQQRLDLFLAAGPSEAELNAKSEAIRGK